MTKFRAVSVRTAAIAILLLGFMFGESSCRTYRDGTPKQTNRQMRQNKANQKDVNVIVSPEKKPDVIIVTPPKKPDVIIVTPPKND